MAKRRPQFFQMAQTLLHDPEVRPAPPQQGPKPIFMAEGGSITAGTNTCEPGYVWDDALGVCVPASVARGAGWINSWDTGDQTPIGNYVMPSVQQQGANALEQMDAQPAGQQRQKAAQLLAARTAAYNTAVRNASMNALRSQSQLPTLQDLLPAPQLAPASPVPYGPFPGEEAAAWQTAQEQIMPETQIAPDVGRALILSRQQALQRAEAQRQAEASLSDSIPGAGAAGSALRTALSAAGNTLLDTPLPGAATSLLPGVYQLSNKLGTPTTPREVIQEMTKPRPQITSVLSALADSGISRQLVQGLESNLTFATSGAGTRGTGLGYNEQQKQTAQDRIDAMLRDPSLLGISVQGQDPSLLGLLGLNAADPASFWFSGSRLGQSFGENALRFGTDPFTTAGVAVGEGTLPLFGRPAGLGIGRAALGEAAQALTAAGLQETNLPPEIYYPALFLIGSQAYRLAANSPDMFNFAARRRARQLAEDLASELRTQQGFQDVIRRGGAGNPETAFTTMRSVQRYGTSNSPFGDIAAGIGPGEAPDLSAVGRAARAGEGITPGNLPGVNPVPYDTGIVRGGPGTLQADEGLGTNARPGEVLAGQEGETRPPQAELDLAQSMIDTARRKGLDAAQIKAGAAFLPGKPYNVEGDDATDLLRQLEDEVTRRAELPTAPSGATFEAAGTGDSVLGGTGGAPGEPAGSPGSPTEPASTPDLRQQMGEALASTRRQTSDVLGFGATPEQSAIHLRRQLRDGLRGYTRPDQLSPGEIQQNIREGIATSQETPQSVLSSWRADPSSVEMGDLESAIRNIEPDWTPTGPRTKAARAATLEGLLGPETPAVQTAPDVNAQRRASQVANQQAPAVETTPVRELETRPWRTPGQPLPPVQGGSVGADILTPEQTAAMSYFTDQTRGLIEAGDVQQYDPANDRWLTGQNVTQRIYARTRQLTTWFSGDVQDSKLAELIGRQEELRSMLRRARPLMPQGELDAAVNAWTDGMLKRYFRGPELTNAQNYLNSRQELLRHGNQQLYNQITRVYKEARLNADISYLGQQVEAGFRRGLVPTSLGIATDTINRLAARMHLPEMFHAYARNDLDKMTQAYAAGVQFGPGAVDLPDGLIDATVSHKYDSLLTKVGRAIDRPLRLLTKAQYEYIGNYMKLRSFEGLMLQGRVFGLDINDPAVQRSFAEMTNTIWSSSRWASAANRALWENRSFLSPRMTRAQVNEIVTLMKTFRSPADVINTANMLGSYAGWLAVGKVLNDNFGIGDFVMDPTQYGFGQITLPDTTENGSKRVINLFPQYSFQRALAQSYMTMSDGDWNKFQQAWQRYGFGRMNLLPSAAAGIAGYGYPDYGGSYGIASNLLSGQDLVTFEDPYTQDERFKPIGGPNDQRRHLGEALISGLPLPLSLGEAVADPNLGGITSALLGQGNYPESVYAAEDRLAKDQYGGSYQDLGYADQVKVHADMSQLGYPIPDWRRIQPFWNADDQAFKELQVANPVLSGYADLSAFEDAQRANLEATGLAPQDIEVQIARIEQQMGITDRRDALRAQAVMTDPGIIDAWQRLYEHGVYTFGPSTKWRTMSQQAQLIGAQ